MPKDNSAKQFRGWTEKHAWAWIFDNGKPSGLSFTIEGGKILASGKLMFDLKRKLYRLEGKEPGSARTAIAFEGKLDSSGKLLVLERLDKKGQTAAESGSMRISLRPNANFLRYTMTQDLKPSGAARFAKAIEVQRGQGRRDVRRRSDRDRATQVHRHRRTGHDLGHVRRSNLPALLLGLPR